MLKISRHRARDIMTNLKNNNEVLGEFVQPVRENIYLENN